MNSAVLFMTNSSRVDNYKQQDKKSQLPDNLEMKTITVNILALT